ncbi:hypothetical protein HIM_04201 [Hirsutella minnesotensis 3608]|uniref:Calpain catalytic domain-containing protein n=1 Tax=Hirsutella minnesotensis 3608 TaxID=1043627 RepID=A0A0F8A1S3_9HYPO|nr:hypothetical protein HIM_04201 [Hirsutella minnesotensis 3608]
MHGYSSSDESDDPRRPRVQPSNDNNQNQKKKRKKRVPPQKSINAIWKKFSNRKFHKALCILPFDPVAPAVSDRPNELLSESYERAADECRRKVQKIVQECKRVNMRYRDPGWDLDFDLRYQRGNCLNSLGTQKFELTKDNLLSSTASVPKAVKRVHEIFEKPTFMGTVNGGDVKQGSLGDCWLMAGLTAMANVEQGLKRSCVAYDTKIGIYGFVFFRDGEWIYSIIDDKLYLRSPSWDCPSIQRDLLSHIDREDVERVYRKTYQTGSKALFFASCKDDENETWVPLMEKAFAKAHGDYASISGGFVGEGIEDLSGGVTTELLSSDILDSDEFWENEMSRVNQEFLFGCSTGLMEHGYGSRNGICEGHAYIVLEARTLSTGERLVKLRNPWGKLRKGVWEGPWSDGSNKWTIEAQEELGHKFGNDSVFWIPYEDLLRKYTHFDRTRLFREADWRCCQRWIGVDVPWKSDYHEKFEIQLTKDSPVVLSLSQLDGRYFKGLHGQYTFRLHFRLHHKDRPEAEDYVVRSHGNYFMKRSVAVELPDLPSGTYVVYLKVTGERDGDVPSVEQVVKRECKDRIENEKLATVGLAYDLAHSKAWEHMDKVASMRNKRNQQKASACRQKERRRLWEKRHLNREVTKKQGQKNEEKKKRNQERKERDRKAREALDSDSDEESANESKKSKGKSGIATPASQDGDEAGDTNGGKNDGADASNSTSPSDTPKTEDSVVVVSDVKKQDVPPISGPPPPPRPASPAIKSKDDKPKSRSPSKPPKPPVQDDGGDSSDSPVDDWEELYSSDDYARKPRLAPQPQPLPKDDYDTEEEKMPDPWNAVCIVGIRVYSKDADLQLRTLMEGGELLEGGMGEKGGEDLDNAQSNAAGMRVDEPKDTAEPIVLGTEHLSVN